MIIVEGPDGVGKSTLVRAIYSNLWRQGYRIDLGHMGKPRDDFDFYWGYANGIYPKIIWDRFHLGELVYGSCIYGCRQIREQVELLEHAIQLVGGVTVVIAATGNWWDLHYVPKREMFTLEEIKQVSDYFAIDIWKRWPVRRDKLLLLNVQRPWPSQEDVRSISELWIQRQAVLQSVWSRCPLSGVKTWDDMLPKLKCSATLPMESPNCPAVNDTPAE